MRESRLDRDWCAKVGRISPDRERLLADGRALIREIEAARRQRVVESTFIIGEVHVHHQRPAQPQPGVLAVVLYSVLWYLLFRLVAFF